MPNQVIPPQDTPKYIATIDEVEEDSGLDFLNTLDEETQDALEAKRASMW